MSDLKIRMFKGTATEPSTTVSIPVGVLKIACNLIPRDAAAELEAQGVDIEAIIRAAEDPDARRVLADEQHEHSGPILPAGGMRSGQNRHE